MFKKLSRPTTLWRKLKNNNMDNQPKVIIQRASKTTQIPTNAMIKNWVNLALNSSPKNVEISIKIVDPEESASLNKQYRQKKGATNVLSFPMSVKTEDLNFLGDLVICQHRDDVGTSAAPRHRSEAIQKITSLGGLGGQELASYACLARGGWAPRRGAAGGAHARALARAFERDWGCSCCSPLVQVRHGRGAGPVVQLLTLNPHS